MKEYRYSYEKNEWLKKKRNIDFEKIKRALSNKRLVEVINHPNNKKYPNQRIFLMRIRKYIYAVPFIEEEAYIFLKTIYPSQKYTRQRLDKKLKVKR